MTEEELKAIRKDDEKYWEYYYKLVELTQPLLKWFGINKVKTYAVFVYDKDVQEFDLGWLFDIYDDEIRFYGEYNENDIPIEAIPIIKEIQEHLKLGKKEGIYD